MKIAVPKFGYKNISNKELDKYEKNGWQFDKEISSSASRVAKSYTAWEQFEIKMRLLFKAIGFENVISDEENFFFEDFGPQIDVCGGVDKFFIMIDCTQSDKEKVNLKKKLQENFAKRARVLKALKAKGLRYDEVVQAICIGEEAVSRPDRAEAEELGITIIQDEFFENCAKEADKLGDSLRYQILRRLGVQQIPASDGREFFEFPALVMKSGTRTLYNFCATPADLVKVAYVRRVDRLDEESYQRELKQSKLKNLNSFLCEDGYYANNLVMCFDTPHQLKFIDSKSKIITSPKAGTFGYVRVPRRYCCGELIDGQHRLYGYLDFSGNPEMAEKLKSRRENDSLSVVAVEDPGENERSLLFVDINTNQTRVPVRDIWALMGRVKPTSQVGYIANLIKSLNHEGPLKGRIHIPDVNKGVGRAINIANMGKGIKDRNLIAKNTPSDRCLWNVFDDDRAAAEYPKQPSAKVISSFNAFFDALHQSAPTDWRRQRDGFLLTNNGINVALRVYAEVLKYLAAMKDKPSAAAFRRVLSGTVGEYIEKRSHKKLRKASSSEVGRTECARDICAMLKIGSSATPKAMAKAAGN